MIRRDTAFVTSGAALLSLISLAWFAAHHELLLYGDAVAHLHIARRVFDTNSPALANLGSVWLPLPHLVLIPFVMVDRWWQSGLAGAIPSALSYVAAVVAMFRLARLWLPATWAGLAAAVFAVNPGLLYMQTTAMTEPLFLALFLWSLAWTAEFVRASGVGDEDRAAAALLKTGVTLASAVLSRYDGWILAALVGVVMLVMRGRVVMGGSKRMRICALIFVVVLVAAPLSWFWFNAHYFHDALDFLRGPYSAKAIEARTAIPGHASHPGFHRPWIAFRYYLRAATMGAAAGQLGNFIVLGLSAIGTFAVVRRDAAQRAVAWLLWFPALFYTYSVAFGSVPIFMPIWPPNAFYNTRYGMELLPALSLFPVAALYFCSRRWSSSRKWISIGAALAAVNALALAWATPVVLREARVNSASRIPFERQIAEVVRTVGPQQRLLMYTSAHAGVLQEAGRPLRETIVETDYYAWPAALADPAGRADIVIAVDGDPVAAAVAAHPTGLAIERVITWDGQPRAIVYRSLKTPLR